jgi:hypothetical protein
MEDPAHARRQPRTLTGWTDLDQLPAAQAKAILACDFLYVDTISLKRIYLLCVKGDRRSPRTCLVRQRVRPGRG